MSVVALESIRFTFALFTCVVSRLAVVVDLTLQCLLQAFRRFASQRSTPRLMLLDNASTYLVEAEELHKLFMSVTLAEDLARRGVE